MLGLLDVVRNAIEGDRARFNIKNGKRSSPIAIARLTDRAGIYQVLFVCRQLQLVLFRLVDGLHSSCDLPAMTAIQLEATLNVAVPEECDRHGGTLQGIHGINCHKHVFVFIQR